MKIIVNQSHSLGYYSKEAFEWLSEHHGWEEDVHYEWQEARYPFADEQLVLKGIEDPRTNEALIDCIESLGEAASARYSLLRVLTIPDDVDWEIANYDGSEWVAEKHRTWR